MNVKIFGTACVITSSLKIDQLKFVQKYNKDAMTLWKDAEKTDPVFSVAVREGAEGSISEAGAVFGKANEAGFAQISMVVRPVDGTDLKEFVADEIGKGIAGLKQFEAAFPAAYEALKAERDGVLSAIEVLG